jgi:hypothetical protein
LEVRRERGCRWTPYKLVKRSGGGDDHRV